MNDGSNPQEEFPVHVSRSRAAAALTIRVIAALTLVFAVGCSNAKVTNLLQQLSQQTGVPTTVAPKTSTIRAAKKVGSVPSLPHGSTCTCPTIVTGTSYGCWEAL